MDEIDIKGLVEYIQFERSRGRDLIGTDKSKKSLSEARCFGQGRELRERQEREWRELLTSLVRFRGGNNLSMVEVDYRPDVDLYYEDSEGIRHYLLRNHTSPTPWQDAFRVLEEDQQLQTEDTSGGRLARILNNGR